MSEINKIHAMFNELEPLAEYALKHLLRFFVNNRTFTDDDGFMFKTPAHADKALTEYLHNKKKVAKKLYDNMLKPYRCNIFEKGPGNLLLKMINIANLDISSLKILLCNIEDFETSFGVGNPRSKKKCANPKHQTNKKCCINCNHVNNEACGNCFLSYTLCKDNAYVCCTSCTDCVHCSKSSATPPCINYKLRYSVVVIGNMRNLKDHKTQVQWSQIQTGSAIPDSFKFCGTTWEDLWDVCKNAVLDISKFLNSKSVIDEKTFNEKCQKIHHIQEMTESETAVSLAKAVLENQRKSTPKRLNICLRVFNTKPKPKPFYKRLFAKKEKDFFKTYFDDTRGLDSPIKSTIKQLLTKSLDEELKKQTNKENSVDDYEIFCTHIEHVHSEKNDKFVVEVSIVSKRDNGFSESYINPYCDKSEGLWETFKEKLEKEALHKMGLKIDAVRHTWKTGSIILTMHILKYTENPWDIFEKNNILNIIHEMNNDINDYIITAKCKSSKELKNEDSILLQYSGDIHKEYLQHAFMNIDLALSLCNQLEILKARIQGAKDVVVNLETFKLMDPSDLLLMQKLKTDSNEESSTAIFESINEVFLLRQRINDDDLDDSAENYKDLLSSQPDVLDNGGKIYQARYDFVACREEHLSFVEGEPLDILDDQRETWWYARSLDTKKEGYIPRNYVVPYNNLKRYKWYFEKMKRVEADRLLLRMGLPGSFIIRESEGRPGHHSLSLRGMQTIKHYQIQTDKKGFYIVAKKHFKDLPALVEHYRKHSSGLSHVLKDPCPKQFPFVDQPFQSDPWEIPRDRIKLKRELGKGNYGKVWEGTWNLTIKVAVKTLKADKMNRDNFLAEAGVMKRLHHPNLVQLYAICSYPIDQPIYIILELMSRGSLNKYFKSSEGRKLTLKDQINMAIQIAGGLLYLENNGVVHRDIAARNILVGENNVVKISDFGLSMLFRNSNSNEDGEENNSFAIKWTAPEAVLEKKFSSKSDVWSFGVLLFEIVTKGETPYSDLSNRDAFYAVCIEGYRMPKPCDCQKNFYDIMYSCWNSTAQDRPNFETLKWKLEEYNSPDKGILNTETSLDTTR